MTTTEIGNADDTTIVEGDDNLNAGGSPGIYTGNIDHEGGQSAGRGLIKFDLSSLPSDITINSAVVRLYCMSEQSTQNFDIVFFRALVEWFEGTKEFEDPGNRDGSTWRRRNENDSDPLDWVGGYGSGGVSGDDWYATPTDTIAITSTGAWYEWDVEADIQDFVDEVHTNHGWFMLGEEGEDDSRKSFHSEQSGTSSRRPELVIDYTVTAGPPAGVAGCCGPMEERGP